MTRRFITATMLLVFGVALTACSAQATERLVTDQDMFRDAVKDSRPGDSIVMADGDWPNFEIGFTGNGTADKPITLRAQTKGQVIITGMSNLRLSGEYLVVSGLVFKNGYTPTNEVIAFRRSETEVANHSRVTETVIDHFNNPERFETDFWVMMYGRHNRFDHNHLEGKSNAGVTMAVRLDSEASQNNHHRIDHNYFGPRPILGSNGGETLRIGTSHYSLTSSHTVVENNFFDRCNGEVEIISNKSGDNVFRGNLFLESRGTLTMRHGNDNLIENNVFLGNRVDHTGGIRLINKRQTIRNNYLAGLTGHRFGGALVIMNGVPNSPINRYHQVEDSLIVNNTLLDSDHIELAAGSDDERSAVPLRTRFEKNLIVNATAEDTIAVHDDISGIGFAGNVAQGVVKAPVSKGFEQRQVTLEKAANGLMYPTDSALAGVGAPRSLSVLREQDTGVSWYPKARRDEKFGTGAQHSVSPGNDTLTTAVASAGAGDVLTLGPGTYHVSKILVVGTPITIRATPNAATRPVLRFERSTLFELADGSGLKLAGVRIDGSMAPDAYGNSVVRTSRNSMLNNYTFEVSNSEIVNLNVNHSFNFLRVSRHTFADSIAIRNSSFSDVTGHVVALDREIDDLGIYNAEYVTVTGSHFKNIGGAAVSVYRGGTDESTFGPHVLINDCALTNVGNNRRNKTASSVYLLGAQVATITGNRFVQSQPLRVIETVGEPVTVVENNTLTDTAAPLISSDTL